MSRIVFYLSIKGDSLQYLVIVSLIWAFSFSLIKTYLTGYNPQMIAFIRLSLSFLVFLPFMNWKPSRRNTQQFLIGSLQFGLMYVLYIQSYQFLKGHQIALLTITTPLFIIIFDALLTKKWCQKFWWSLLFVLAGSVLLVPWPTGTSFEWKGVVLVQAANACFAAGQILQKRLGAIDLHRHFGWSFLGALCVPLLALIVQSGFSPVFLSTALPNTSVSWLVLIYLGIISSGLAFYLWNKGVCCVNSGLVSIMNNLKIPLAVLVSFFIFQESVNWLRFLASSICFIIASRITWNEK